MSVLVQTWEHSYQFGEDELYDLAELHNWLCNPEPAPRLAKDHCTYSQPLGTGNHSLPPNNHSLSPDHHSLSPDNHSLLPDNHSLLPNNHSLPPDNISLRCYQDLMEIKDLEDKMSLLGQLLDRLKDEHEQVKSKSLVMQSIWEGLLRRQKAYSALCGELEKTLSIYADAQRISALLGGWPDSDASANWTTMGSAFHRAVEGSVFLKEHADYVDSALYLLRYKQCLGYGIGLFRQHFRSDLMALGLHPHENDISALEGINVGFGRLAAKFGGLFRLMGQAVSMYSEFESVVVEMLDEYCQTRVAIVLPLLKTHAQACAHMALPQHVCVIVTVVCGLLADEEALFGQMFGNVDSEKYFCSYAESLILPTLRYLKTAIEAELLKTDAKAELGRSLAEVAEAAAEGIEGESLRFVGILSSYLHDKFPVSQ